MTSIDPRAYLDMHRGILARVAHIVELDRIQNVSADDHPEITDDGVRLMIKEPLWGARGEFDVSYQTISWDTILGTDEDVLAAREVRLAAEAEAQKKRDAAETEKRIASAKRVAFERLVNICREHPELVPEGSRLAVLRLDAVQRLERLNASHTLSSTWQREQAQADVDAAIAAEMAYSTGHATRPG